MFVVKRRELEASADELDAYNSALDHVLMDTDLGKQFAHRKL